MGGWAGGAAITIIVDEKEDEGIRFIGAEDLEGWVFFLSRLWVWILVGGFFSFFFFFLFLPGM